MAYDAGRAAAERYLHDLQRAAWESDPPPPGSSLAQAAELRKTLRERIAADPSYVDEFRNRFRDASQSDKLRAEAFIAAGEYEDPWAYSVVASASEDVERALTELGRRVPGPVVVGTARTRQVNAEVIPLGPGIDAAHVVVIDGGLLPFLADFSHLVASLLPMSRGEQGTSISFDPEAVDAHLHANNALVDRAADDAARFVVGAYPLEQAWTDDSLVGATRTLANVLYRLLSVFVVGHEYAHFHLGHTGPPPAGQAGQVGVDGIGVAQLVDGWFHESEADGGGVEIALRVGGRYAIDPSISYLACELFFIGEQIVELGQQMLASGSIEAAVDEINRVEALALNEPQDVAQRRSHPPPGLRRKALRTIMRGSTTPEGYEAVVGTARSFDATYAKILEWMLIALEPRLLSR